MSNLFGSPRQHPFSEADLQERKDALMAQVRSDVQSSNAKELLDNMTEKCYSKCVPKPGATMSSSEETCVGRCMDLYFQAFNTVAKTYALRLHRERIAMREASSME